MTAADRGRRIPARRRRVTAVGDGKHRHGRALLVANALLLTGALTALFTVGTGSTSMRVGQVASETVVVQHRVTYADSLATDARRRAAAAAVGVVFRFDAALAARRRQEAGGFMRNLAPLVNGGAGSVAIEAAMRRFLPAGVTSTALQQFPALSTADFAVVRQRSLMLLTQAEAWSYAQNQLQSTALALLGAIPPSVSLKQRTAIAEVLTTFMAPTQVADLAATKRRQKTAEAAVLLQYSTLYPGQVVIRRGDLVTPVVMAQLDALGLQNRIVGLRDVISSFLFGAVIVGMLFWYLHAFQPLILLRPRLVLLIDASILLAVSGTRVIGAGHVLLPFMLPLAAIPTFAAVLVAPEASVAMALAMSLLAGWAVANSFELSLYYFLTSAAGVLAVRQVRQLKQFIAAGIYISIIGLTTALAFGIVDRSYDFVALREIALAAAVNGFVSSALALGGFAMLSSFFGVTTILQFYELAQPHQPLLRRLTTRAPGTWNHSLIVSTMVEQAAEAIGADSLAAKVAALYHDVGKTVNPHCFIENQLGMANIHDELEAEESARIIRGHVVQGLRLARQFKLPHSILDAIAQHHGTMTLTYFWQKAQTQGLGEADDTSLFTYPGPKPQTREAGLLMLADGCESAVRASPDHSPEGIRATVRQIVHERSDSRQLDECPLTLRDLDSIQRAFCSVLNGLYHPRIVYPETTDLPPPRELPARVRDEQAASGGA